MPFNPEENPKDKEFVIKALSCAHEIADILSDDMAQIALSAMCLKHNEESAKEIYAYALSQHTHSIGANIICVFADKLNMMGCPRELLTGIIRDLIFSICYVRLYGEQKSVGDFHVLGNIDETKFAELQFCLANEAECLAKDREKARSLMVEV